MSSIKFSLEEVREKLNLVRDDVIIIDYNGMNNNSTFECEICGYRWEDLPVRILGNKKCPNCRKNNKAEIIEKAQKILSKYHKDDIIINDFSGTALYHGRFFLHCNICGNDWDTSIEPIIRGNGCRKCSDKIRGINLYKKEEDIIDILNNKGFKFIRFLEDFNGINTNLLLEYSCGHLGETSYRNIYQHETSVCPDCSFEKSKEKKLLNIDIIKSRFVNEGFELLSVDNRNRGVNSLCEYKCIFGHITKRKICEFFINPTCSECEKQKMKLRFSGEKSLRWRGGITRINKYVRRNIKSWNLESAKNCNFLCAIEGKPFDTIHHLYSFNLILEEVFKELGLDIRSSIGDYTEDELNIIKQKSLEKHNELLGVCLTKNVHGIFHKLYGYGNNTPEQFEEFKQRIASGEITIPD